MHLETLSIVRNANLHNYFKQGLKCALSASPIQTSSRLRVSRFCLAKIIAQSCWRVASLVSRCGFQTVR
jgi:hypothetical protein